MLTLNANELKNKALWEAAGIRLPGYDVAAMQARTLADPAWLHFGPGNIFRAFLARLQQRLLREGKTDVGILAAETFDPGILDAVYTPHDCLTLLALMHSDGTLEKEVVAGMAATADRAELARVFRSPGLQMVSLTITEKGYALRGMGGAFLPVVARDLAEGPDHARHTMSILTALLHQRYRSGGAPLAVVSMDNCSRNGERLRNSVLAVAEAWQGSGFVEPGFLAWLGDEGTVSFPWSMIDKITPRPAPEVQVALEALGLADMAPVVTPGGTHIAPFVNAEVPEYLVVEDRFPNGRPPLEEVGVYFADRETVQKSETMKVTTCLNPLHTAMAVYGCLLGHTSIAEEMRDPEIRALVERIGYAEGLPVAVHPGIFHPKDFLDEVVGVRLPNASIPDTPQRIATDTSQKIAIRFGETIKAYAEAPDRDPATLVGIPLALAGWLRYLLGLDDGGNPFQPSPDPLLEELREALAGVRLGDPASCDGVLEAVLDNRALFGVDLKACGLTGKMEGLFRELIAGPGAVRATLRRNLG